MPDAVDIRGLTVERGGRTVIDGLDLTIPTGVVTGLVGPSGCGKTTLIRAVAGVQVVRSGVVTVLGEPAGSATTRRRVGYVTQAGSIYPDLTTAQNLRYFAAVHRLAPDQVDEVLRAVDLTEVRDREVRHLSGGQRTRVSLAAALVAEPDLYLLDEPTVGLDPVLRRDLWQMFAELGGRGATLQLRHDPRSAVCSCSCRRSCWRCSTGSTPSSRGCSSGWGRRCSACSRSS